MSNPLEVAIEAVRALHKPVMEYGEAVGCECCDWDVPGNQEWPCATIAAIEGVEA